jgi:hypothetical protein
MLQLEGIANVLFFIAAILLAVRRPKPSLIVSILALIFAAETFSLVYVGVPVYDTGTARGLLSQVDLGFFLWVGSMLTILVTAAVQYRTTLRQ